MCPRLMREDSIYGAELRKRGLAWELTLEGRRLLARKSGEVVLGGAPSNADNAESVASSQSLTEQSLTEQSREERSPSAPSS